MLNPQRLNGTGFLQDLEVELLQIVYKSNLALTLKQIPHTWQVDHVFQAYSRPQTSNDWLNKDILSENCMQSAKSFKPKWI